MKLLTLIAGLMLSGCSLCTYATCEAPSFAPGAAYQGDATAGGEGDAAAATSGDAGSGSTGGQGTSSPD